MGFKICFEKMSNSFSLPADVADKCLKLAGAVQLRVILYCFKNMSEEIDPSKISKAISVSPQDVTDALMFWSELGILSSDGENPVAVKQNIKAENKVHKIIKPDRAEVARRGTESPEIAFLLNEAQKKFGRMLKQSESSALVWMYDDLGMDASLILMVIEYALKAGKCNISYIEKVAKDWIQSGIESISDAESRIVELNNARSAWNVMRAAFGLDQRAPSDSEAKLAKQCVLEWGMSRELLKNAYNICIDSIGKYKASYIKTVLTAWHKKGIKTVKDLENAEEENTNPAPKKQTKKSNQYYASYDISLMDKIIDGE